MAYLPEENEWVDPVYQVAVQDPVQGGDDGIDNTQGRAYASRTLWLKNQFGNVADLLST
jgi:hypothetical protein